MHIFHIPAYTDNYIWVIKKGNNVSLIDPGDSKPVLEVLDNNELILQDILITHHHFDHTGGLLPLKSKMQGKAYGPKGNIEGLDIHLEHGDSCETLGYEFEVLATPGHTLDHIIFYNNEDLVLFCGDTLFSAGCGRLFEGTYEQMHESLQMINKLNEKTMLYCAHEYTESNLKFVTNELDDIFVNNYYETVKKKREKNLITIPTSLSTERKINPFLLMNVPDNVKKLSKLDQFKELRIRKDNF